MKKLLVIGTLVFLAAGAIAGCDLLGLDGEVEVRIRNGSSFHLDEATLLLPTVSLAFSDLQPGQETPYTQVAKAYRIASAEAVLGQDTARVQVIDYVGETPLGGGRYTYVFRVSAGDPPSLGLDFQKGR